MNLTDFENAVDSRVKDAAGKLATADKDDAIFEAVKRYSKDRPRELVSDVAGKGTAFLDLPAVAGPPAVGFEDGFSAVRAIEFPVGDVPPTLIENSQWRMYRDPAGLKVMLTETTPAATDTLRITWTARHNPGTSGTGAVATTVPDADFEAVSCLAAAICAEKLASIYAQTQDPSMAADAVSYRTKSQEYTSLAGKLRKRYFDHLGIEEDGSGGGGAPTAASLAMGDMDLMQGSGVDRLTHKRPR